MAHGITEFDNGAVGFTEIFGGTWHQLEQYKELDGAVPLEAAREILEYEVVKVPLAFHVEDPDSNIADMNGKLVITPDMRKAGGVLASSRMYSLVRTDHKIAVYGQSVSDGYEIFPNKLFLDYIDSQIFSEYQDLAIESCGTLWGGRVAFLNILLDKFVVKGDNSQTLSRMMLWNAFGGQSIAGCCHNTRVVCNNTLMLAESQGEINKSLKKFKHTKMAAEKVTNHLIDLAKVNCLVKDKKDAFDFMSSKSMSTNDVENFLGHLFPIQEDAGGASITRRTNNRQDVLNIFENCDNLQGNIARTRYAMLSAVTDYNQHHTLNKSTDSSAAWWDVATGGVRDKLNQSAFSLLSNDEIPVLHNAELVLN